MKIPVKGEKVGKEELARQLGLDISTAITCFFRRLFTFSLEMLDPKV